MKVRRAVTAALLVTLAGCSSVGDVYDKWFGAAPKSKPAALVAFKATSQPRIA